MKISSKKLAFIDFMLDTKTTIFAVHWYTMCSYIYTYFMPYTLRHSILPYTLDSSHHLLFYCLIVPVT